VKPAARNSNELMNIATGGCEASASCVGFHSSKARPEASSSTRLNHFNHKSLLAVVELGTLVILPSAAFQVELFLAACSIPRIPKFEEPVMARAHKLLLLRGPEHIFLSKVYDFFLYSSYVLIICLYQSNLVYRWERECLHIYVYILLTIDRETVRNPNCLV